MKSPYKIMGKPGGYKYGVETIFRRRRGQGGLSGFGGAGSIVGEKWTKMGGF